ncbi:MAG: DUF2442 domain-containing protein [Ginsengibacter sp.]
MYFLITDVTPLNNYLLHLKFRNVEEKFFDMKPYLEIVIFKELKDENIFNTAKGSFDTVEWANEADIDPETLYHESVELKK